MTTSCTCADVVMWQALFLAMGLIALVLAFLAEPVSRRYERVQTYIKKKVGKKK